MVKTKQETVWDLCKKRGKIRDGLRGLRMKHLPSGIEFVCEVTEWSDASESQYLVIIPATLNGLDEALSHRRVPLEKPRLGVKREAVWQRLSDVEREAVETRLKASQCILLEPWPR
ncbi:hypothetical protein [Singulisphaera sp. PoT]|uniref:hypothetical protein n=1 Tax=Singulisphaera sp. PoT TaxID=3411797 RepID=UPI003BF59941